MLLNFSLYNRSHREHTANKATNTGANDNSQHCWPTMLGVQFSPPPSCALRKMPRYLPERKKRFPSWAGAEKIRSEFEFRRENGIFVATGPGPCSQIEMTSLDFVF